MRTTFLQRTTMSFVLHSLILVFDIYKMWIHAYFLTSKTFNLEVLPPGAGCRIRDLKFVRFFRVPIVVVFNVVYCCAQI